MPWYALSEAFAGKIPKDTSGVYQYMLAMLAVIRKFWNACSWSIYSSISHKNLEKDGRKWNQRYGAWNILHGILVKLLCSNDEMREKEVPPMVIGPWLMAWMGVKSSEPCTARFGCSAITAFESFESKPAGCSISTAMAEGAMAFNSSHLNRKDM
jgi:hypothetical protein